MDKVNLIPRAHFSFGQHSAKNTDSHQLWEKVCNSQTSDWLTLENEHSAHAQKIGTDQSLCLCWPKGKWALGMRLGPGLRKSFCLCQSTSCKNLFHLQVYFICKSKSFSFEWFCTKTCFETEANGTLNWPVEPWTLNKVKGGK